MGAWGHDTFDNDTACDWADQLADADDLTPVQTALAQVVEAEAGYLDAEIACEALAACEVVARLRGQFGVRNSYTEAVDNWVSAHGSLNTDALLKTAHQVMDRISGEESELAELWGETEYAQAWLAAILELRSRLQ